MTCQWQKKKRCKPEIVGESLPSFSGGKPKGISSWWLPPAGSEATQLSPSPEYCYLKYYIWAPSARSSCKDASDGETLSRLQAVAALRQRQELPSSALPGKKSGFKQGQAQPEGGYGHANNVSSGTLLSLTTGWYSVNYWVRTDSPKRRRGRVSLQLANAVRNDLN